jgi:hypothetical protein
MNRYLMLLGIAIIVFSIAGGSLEIANGYNQYQSHMQVAGPPGTNPLNVFDEVQWQLARLVGGGIIMGGLVAGSILMGLSWIGQVLEQVRDSIAHATTSARAVQG